ncbi:hypothetical protein J4401_04240 [Candidatus Woesearchaeota archaeon]|nr:hypothetical protein [Candidatus Woesearchaeota archaeon]
MKLSKKWMNLLAYLDKAVIAVSLLLFLYIRPDMLMLSLFMFLFVYLYVSGRASLFRQLGVAFIVSVIWMLIAKDYYNYNKEMLQLLGFNLFPLLGWTSGLFSAYVIYSHYEHILKVKTFFRKLLLFVAFYWPLLILFETLGYHVFKIRNMEHAYSGLPICDCIHAIWWMKISYFLIGIVFFAICHAMKLENPHRRRE